MSQKVALITGITGQDGSYLAELLLEKGYRVYGMLRRSSTERHDRIRHLLDKLDLVYADLLDQGSLISVLQQTRPGELYNLAAQSFVPASWQQPVLTSEFTGMSVVKLLESVRLVDPQIKFYQASSSEMFGKVQEVPQSESTPFYPRSPYGAAKAFAHYVTVNYRESYGLFTCSGILFNHESPRRGLEFVSRKVTHAAAKIKLGLADQLDLGNLDARRDWGFAADYVNAMWLMMQQEQPEDYVIATGKARTVRQLVQAAFDVVGLDWQKYVKIDQKLLRPAEVDSLVGDAGKAFRQLSWQPQVTFDQMIEMMVKADLESLKKEC